MVRNPVTQTTDEVIQETGKIKAALAESMGYDIDRILKEAKINERNSGRRLLSPPVGKNA